MADGSLIESTQRFYDTVARQNPNQAFLNYGYADTAEPPGETAPDLVTVCRRLYQEVLTPFPEAERALEVGCGRGGGAAFLLEHQPALKYLGLDLSREHVAVCRRRFESLGRNASFAQANASQLPVQSDRFDVAFSVEAVHHFDDIERFYRDVARALRPGGWFLLTGLWRPGEGSDASFEAAGFAVKERCDITPNVIASLTRTSDLRQQLIESLDLPERFRPLLFSWAGVRGHGAYESLASGALRYLRFRLQRS
jgi:ubiquinone/menaquinone biosynthesis C-methylase UbiE